MKPQNFKSFTKMKQSVKKFLKGDDVTALEAKMQHVRANPDEEEDDDEDDDGEDEESTKPKAKPKKDVDFWYAEEDGEAGDDESDDDDLGGSMNGIPLTFPYPY